VLSILRAVPGAYPKGVAIAFDRLAFWGRARRAARRWAREADGGRSSLSANHIGVLRGFGVVKFAEALG
jgi:hypothetical protein